MHQNAQICKLNLRNVLGLCPRPHPSALRALLGSFGSSIVPPTRNPGSTPGRTHPLKNPGYAYVMHFVLVGLPAITLPVALSSNQLPIGLQLIGRQFAERQLLSAAKAVERLVDFRPFSLDFLDD